MVTAESPSRRRRQAAPARLLGLDAFELCCLVALAGVPVAVLLPLALQGRSLSGADGVLAPDQFQYFAWIRECGSRNRRYATGMQPTLRGNAGLPDGSARRT